jgi:L-malate glycosyltransferase
MTKPVILIIENSIDLTGAFIGAARAAETLKSQYHFCFVLPKKSKASDWLEQHGFTTYIIPMVEIRKSFFSLISYLPMLCINTFRLRRIVSREKVSIIHVNDLYNLLPALLKILGNSVPYICHVRFLPDKFPAWLFNFWLKVHFRFAARIITVSQFLHERLPMHSKLVLVYNGIHFDEKWPDENLNTHSKRTFLYLGNLINGKGQNFALEAFARLQPLPGWTLRFVGGDMGLEKNRQYANRLNLQAKVLGVAEKIEWAGFTLDVEKEYKHADIVLNFSESESFSLTCAEALYFGRPVIATNCGGPSEIVDHMKSGLLVSNKAVEEMKDGMLWLASQPDKIAEFGRYGKRKVRAVFTSAETARKINNIYAELIKK